MVKYDGRRKKKVKGGHCLRYRDNDEIEALHGLYNQPKDNYKDVGDDEDKYGNWDDMEEKEW